MADTTYYVDTDVVGGAADGSSWANAFSRLYDAEALNLDLTTGDTDGVCTIYCRASAGTADTTKVAWNGWTMDAGGYVEIIGSDDFSGKWDATKYRLSCTNGTALSLRDQYIRLDNLQIEVTAANANGQAAIYIYAIVAGGSEFRISNCIIRNHASDTYWGVTLYAQDTDICNLYVWNCVLQNRIVFDSLNNVCMYINIGGTAYIYNNTCWGAGATTEYGIRRVAGTVNAYNNVCNNIGGYAFAGTFNAGATNISGDATDTGAASDINNTTLTFANTANSDFHLAATDAAAIGAATVDPGSGLFSDDLDDVVRGAAWDIGALEYVAAAGGLSIPVAMAAYQQQ